MRRIKIRAIAVTAGRSILPIFSVFVTSSIEIAQSGGDPTIGGRAARIPEISRQDDFEVGGGCDGA